MSLACRLCILQHGLHGAEIGFLPQTEAELREHIEREHHTPVRRDGESDEESLARLRRQYPESADPATCRCPQCRRERAMMET